MGTKLHEQALPISRERSSSCKPPEQSYSLTRTVSRLSPWPLLLTTFSGKSQTEWRQQSLFQFAVMQY